LSRFEPRTLQPNGREHYH